MARNFLPKYEPERQNTKTGKTLRCEIRSKVVNATPEERVRQRVLHWLIHEKHWPRENLRVEQSYAWVGNVNRSRVRTDIELVKDEEVAVVIECKSERVPLSQKVDDQAIDYAVKSGAGWIWTTNGESHGFMRKSRNGWEQVAELEPLKVMSDPPVTNLRFPEDTNDSKAVAKYFKDLNDPQFLAGQIYDLDLLLAFHRLLFDIPKKLPFSHGGLHLLEDRGAAWHQFMNRSGGGYHTRYADFMAATQGTVEAVSIALNRWRDSGAMRICVGLTKPNRKHHALQLDTAKCEWNERRTSCSIYCDGTMSQVKNKTVLEAVREARAGAWIKKDDDGKERICLGELSKASRVTWSNSRELLCNLIHYGIIRSNLREATGYK